MDGSFYIKASPVLSSEFVIVLQLSGSSRNEYTSQRIPITVLNSFTPPPAPMLRGAMFSDSGGYVVILFDSATNKAGLSSGVAWPCSSLFNFDKAILTQCVWLNSTAIKASFVTGTAVDDYVHYFSKYLTNFVLTPAVGYLEPGCNITLLPRLLQAECSSALTTAECDAIYPFSYSQTILVSTPFHPMLPIVNLGTPPIIGCDNLTIDTSTSSGSGGRPWRSVTWTSDSAAVAQYLNTYGLDPSVPISVPNVLLSGNSLSLTITLENFLRASNSASTSISIRKGRGVPMIKILGPNVIYVKAGDSVQVSGMATVSICSVSSLIYFNWTVFDGELIFGNTSINSDPRKMELLPYTLESGKTYQAD